MALLAGLAARSVSITDGMLSFEDKSSGAKTNLEINDIHLSAPSADDSIKVHTDVVFNGNGIVADVTGGSINTFLDAQKPFPVALTARAFGASAKVSGSLSDIMTALRYDMAVEASNPAGNMGAPEVNLKTRAAGDLKRVSLDISLLEVAKSKITGLVSADISGRIPSVEANLKSDLIDLTKFAPAKKTAFVLPELVSSAQASALVPNDKIPYEFLKLANAKVQASVGKLVISPDMAATNVALTAALAEGVLKVVPLTLDFGGGSLSVNSTVDANAKGLSLTLSSQGMRLQDLHKEFAATGKGVFGVREGGDFDADITVSASGETYRQMVNALDGQAVVIVSPAKLRVSRPGSSGQAGFLSQLVKALQMDKQGLEEIDLNCAVLRADLGQGKAVLPNGIAVDAAQMKLSGNGTFNLVSDAIDFTIKPSMPKAAKFEAAEVGQLLASLIKVGGTTLHPTVGVDINQAGKAVVGVIVGNVMKMPAHAIRDNLSQVDAAPCYTALLGTKYASRFPKPERTVEQESESKGIPTAKEVEATVKDVGKAAKEHLKSLQDNPRQLLDTLKALGK
jgi:hypothetical protein